MRQAWRSFRARATRALWENAVSRHREGGRVSPGNGPRWTRTVEGSPRPVIDRWIGMGTQDCNETSQSKIGVVTMNWFSTIC
jgi:hypothetical protein